MQRILVGAAIATAAITHGCGDKEAPAPSSRGSGEAPGKPKVSAPAPPVLADAAAPRPKLPERDPAREAFASETRDAEWAPATERELARRFGKLHGAKLEQAECRTSRCRVVVAGSQGDVGQTIADLEGPRGLHGYARNVMLGLPSKRADGTVELGLYVIFER